MSQENLQNETQFRRFLLGEMPESERLEFEEKFIADEELFENLRVAEDELIESYIRGTLSVSEKMPFEQNYLSNPKRREKIEFTRQMLEKFAAESALKTQKTESETVSIWANLLNLFKQPQFAFGSAIAILLLVFGGWFLMKNSQKTVEIVQNTPIPTPTSTPVSANKNQVPEQNNPNNQNEAKPEVSPKTIQKEKTPEITKKVEPKEIEKVLKTPTPNSIITTLALFTGGVRSDGKTNELNLPKNSGGLNLQLNLESQDYQFYRAEIVDQNGAIIYRSGKLSANKAKVYAFVPTKNLKRGDYIVRLFGKNAQNQDESAADYQFRVNQK